MARSASEKPPRRVSHVMNRHPLVIAKDASLLDAALCMRDAAIGSVIVPDGDHLSGILTDRDIVVRAVAEGRPLDSTSAAAICSRELTTVGPTDSLERAMDLMGERAIRRLPVVEYHRLVGIVSLGDLARGRDPRSALADISAAPPSV